jgi:GAF domain-containing protein
MNAVCDDDGSVLSAGALAESVRAALAGRSPEQALQAAIDLAVTTAPCDHASITLLGRRHNGQTVASTGDRTDKADLLQYELDEGPGLDAARTDDLSLAQDLTTDRQWPRWAPRAVALGIRGVIAVRLFTDTPLGTLNLYSEQPRNYDQRDLQSARVVAAHTSVILEHTRTTQNLRRAIESRNLIGQAQGILMAHYRLTPQQALALLRRCSQTTNIRVTALAEELTRTGRLPGLHPDDPPTATEPS